MKITQFPSSDVFIVANFPLTFSVSQKQLPKEHWFLTYALCLTEWNCVQFPSDSHHVQFLFILVIRSRTIAFCNSTKLCDFRSDDVLHQNGFSLLLPSLLANKARSFGDTLFSYHMSFVVCFAAWLTSLTASKFWCVMLCNINYKCVPTSVRRWLGLGNFCDRIECIKSAEKRRRCLEMSVYAFSIDEFISISRRKPICRNGTNQLRCFVRN